MFKSLGRCLTDLSTDLRERQDWEVGTLRTLDQLLNASSFAFDPVSSILAIGAFASLDASQQRVLSTTGTLDGTIRIFGAPGVETSVSLSSQTPVKFLQFATNLLKLVCIGEESGMYSLWIRVLNTSECIDGNDKLYLWDLTPHDQIKLETSIRFNRPVTSV